MPAYPAAAVEDIRSGIAAWRIWTMLATSDIKQRYSRSSLGQFWLTLSMGVTVFGMGLVYSILFNTEIKAYIPFLAVSFVFWGFISGVINDSTMAFIENERIMLHTPIAPSAFVFRTIARNLIILAHNALIIPLVFLIFGVGINANILWLLITLILVAANCFWISFVLAIVCARYRDVPQVVTSVMQIMFFVTPVVYKPDQLASHPYIVLANPLASLLQVVRDPILGNAPSIENVEICLALLVAGSLFMMFFANRYVRRIVYWL